MLPGFSGMTNCMFRFISFLSEAPCELLNIFNKIEKALWTLCSIFYTFKK